MGEYINLNLDWKFTRNYDQRAWQKNYNDSEWRDVTLPHDWAVEEPFDQKNSSGTGYLAAGIGWYRKKFELPEDMQGKLVYITFDGVYNNSQVWCNGYYLGKRPYGYSTFTYDISDFIYTGEEDNIIVVKVNHEHIADSRWYTGSGIYRKVTLSIKDKVCFDSNGIFVTTESADEKSAVINIQASVTNHSDENEQVQIAFELKKSEKITMSYDTTYKIKAGETINVDHKMNVSNPHLWSPDSPELYTVTAQIIKDDILDSEDIITGIRTFYFDADKGLFLNGKNIKMKGVCVHHDAGCLGAAVRKKVWERRLKKLKDMGCNAIRMAHNPHMPELYELCDSMGFLVEDEAFDEWEGVKNKWACGHNVYPPSLYGYSEDFPAWHEADLVAMILRDRNHPSIILWSIGNEIDYPNDPYAFPILEKAVGNNDANKPESEQVYDSSRPSAKRLAVIGARLIEIVKKYDNTRPVSAGIAFPEYSNHTGFSALFKVAGYNYKEQFYEPDHAAYPERVIFGSENGHHIQAWRAVVENDYISGQFLWTGIDFLGETRGWPCHGSQAGLLDVAGYEKSSFYFRKSLWSDKPMVQLAAGYASQMGRWVRPDISWNFKTGENIQVTCYTNCDEVELFLNGESLGVKKLADNTDNYYMTWEVPFEKGELNAVGKTGEKICECILSTYGAPTALSLSAADNKICADGQDITHVEIEVHDCDGNLSANANPVIDVSVEGPGVILGLENGNLFDNTPYSEKYRSANNGRLLVYILAGREAGKIKVKAASHGLLTGEIEIEALR